MAFALAAPRTSAKGRSGKVNDSIIAIGSIAVPHAFNIVRIPLKQGRGEPSG